ncbi:uncharacterized protein LOC129741616 [Uranotaenia lowii]|uniref:uncharacterized protein LOC129741616 n=1 Tax=Uranotaenia lowii TaxID=190385 RepID=UPI002479A32B|nr:uncharacterized protein LOC129741616 [Uranotaenia lowii]
MFKTITAFSSTLAEVTSVEKIQVRLAKIDELWEKVNETLLEIETHEEYVTMPNTSPSQIRIDFGETYYDAKAAMLERVKEIEQESSTVHQSTRMMDSSLQPTVEHVKLPQIKLQQFDGNVDEWLSFRDLYMSLIHTKADLPDIEKFHYLKGCLAGEAKKLVDPLAITSANYSIAWECLMKRYNDSKLLKRRQVNALLKLPGVTKESVMELQSLLEAFERVVQTLDQLVNADEYKDLLLLEILCTRLDPTTRRAWEEHTAGNDRDKISDLTQFIQKRISVLGSLPSKVSEGRPEYNRKPLGIRTSHSATQFPKGRCVACSDFHPLFMCQSFKRLSVSERDKMIRTNSLCRNCFRRGHVASECSSKYVCHNCKGKHHTLICFRPDAPTPSTSGAIRHTSDNPGTSTSGTVSANIARRSLSSVLLATAVVLVEDQTGGSYPARALLDSGSECNFMAEHLCQKLGIKRRHSNLSVIGIGQANTRIKHQVTATVKSRNCQYKQQMDFLVMAKVTADLPTTDINISTWRLPEGIKLADSEFFASKSIDLILGIQHFFEFFQSGQRIALGNGLPVITESVFGWIISGVTENRQQISKTVCNTASSMDLDEYLTRFWTCEEMGSVRNYSPEEALCEEQFASTVRREEDGRYTVSLPKDGDATSRLGESRKMALQRFEKLENRLQRNTNLRQQYNLFVQEYLQLGHMRKVDLSQGESKKRCYLPHHPVFKEASTTTKLRVVFDASALTSNGLSLNDTLLAGPVIQDELRSIVLRCRTKQFLIVADVEKMFRQINVCEEDKALQSILWRFDPTEPVDTYELTTVTYGTKPAPFLATRTLLQLTRDEGIKYPLAAKAMSEDVYMDDVLTGTEKEHEAIQLREQLIELTKQGGFRLRKFASNSRAVLQGIQVADLAIAESGEVELDSDPTIKTLGLVWQPATDTFRFQFNIKTMDPNEMQTKRRILGAIAALFDPLGLLGAVITTAKVFMQRLWCLMDENGQPLDWDSKIPDDMARDWMAFYTGIPKLNELRIPRCTIVPDAVDIQLHIFSDASERAYGACVYARSVNSKGKVCVQLLTSKSRVSPLKSQSIPRLELCGALKAAELGEKVKESIKSDVKMCFWTDSTCVLQWLKSLPTTWSTYVANRVSKIQTITENQSWRHVPGEQNPADLVSRGLLPEQIESISLWWEGPPWLKQETSSWPVQPIRMETEAVTSELKRKAANVATTENQRFIDWYVEKFSSFSDLIRKTAYWMRLIKHFRKLEPTPTGFLTTPELKEAEYTIIRLIQQSAFSEEWKQLSKGEEVHRGSPMRYFNPILESDNLIRLGGRLKYAQIPEGARHPIALPVRHHFTKLLLEAYHKRLLHAAPQLLLSNVRLHYWPLGGRSYVRHIVHQCLRCHRTKPKAIEQFMGELPRARVTAAPPFARTGIDYFGPVYIRQGPRRAPLKAYVALFICLCTKAIHLELVSDLSTEKFLQALRRFIGRRSIPTDLFSDNGTNFVGARNQLKDLLANLRDRQHHQQITKECAEQGIQWHFNPPAAPHFGGLWEAAVKSAKIHLLKVLGDNAVSYEDFNTLLIQVEACLNSRPITPLSEDPNDLEPLTPGHFIAGRPLQQLPDRDFTDKKPGQLKQYQLMQQKLQFFWARWHNEYLSQLQGRFKRWKRAVEIKVGQLVVLKNENTPPMRWRLGRIQQLHPGEDGVVRVVTLKTSSGVLKRPVEKLCLLPSECQPLDSETTDDNKAPRRLIE